MSRLGYTRYVAQGGDVGASVTDQMGRQAPDGAGRHPHEPARHDAGGRSGADGHGRGEGRPGPRSTPFRATGFGYFLEMATRPQTIGYAQLDSPIALAAWLADHDTDAYYKIASAFVDDKPSGNLTRDHILDNITDVLADRAPVPSAARLVLGERQFGRRRRRRAGSARGQAAVVGFTTFPGEIWQSPRSWVRGGYPNLTYFNKVDKGGHFAAWEEPELFATEVRAAFRPLRSA
jgi:hypothetical protein